MPVSTLDFVKDMFFLLLFLVGTLWMWGILKFPKDLQQKMEHLFRRSRTRFKWMFLIGLLLLGGLFIWQYLINR